MKKFNRYQLEVIKFAIQKEFEEDFRQHSGMQNETFDLFMEYQKMEANPDIYEDFMRDATYNALLLCIENFEVYMQHGKEKAEKHIKDKHEKEMQKMQEESEKRHQKMMKELDELIARKEREEA